MTEHSHRNLVSSNLMRDLRAATTACESCTMRPFDEALSFALMSPVPTATTVHPPTGVWKEILVKHKRKFCTVSCLSAHLDFGWRPIISNWFTDFKTVSYQNDRLLSPYLTVVTYETGWRTLLWSQRKRRTLGGRSWVLPADPWHPVESLGCLNSSFLNTKKKTLWKIQTLTLSNTITALSSVFFFCPKQNQHFKSPPVIHKHPPQCQLNYREETEKKNPDTCVHM